MVTVFGTAAGPLITGVVSDRIAANGLALSVALAIVVTGAGLTVFVVALVGGRGWSRLAADLRASADPANPLTKIA